MKDAGSDLGCRMCEKGTYNDVLNAESCTPCPEGQTTYSNRARSADQCYGKEITIFKIPLDF